MPFLLFSQKTLLDFEQIDACWLTHFMSLISFYTPWKHKNQRFSDIFRYGKRPVAWKGLKEDSTTGAFLEKFCEIFKTTTPYITLGSTRKRSNLYTRFTWFILTQWEIRNTQSDLKCESSPSITKTETSKNNKSC